MAYSESMPNAVPSGQTDVQNSLPRIAASMPRITAMSIPTVIPATAPSPAAFHCAAATAGLAAPTISVIMFQGSRTSVTAVTPARAQSA